MKPNLKIVTIYKSLLQNYPKKGNKKHDDFYNHSANRGYLTFWDHTPCLQWNQNFDQLGKGSRF